MLRVDGPQLGIRLRFQNGKGIEKPVLLGLKSTADVTMIMWLCIRMPESVWAFGLGYTIDMRCSLQHHAQGYIKEKLYLEKVEK